MVAVLALALGLFWTGWHARQPTINALTQRLRDAKEGLTTERTQRRRESAASRAVATRAMELESALHGAGDGAAGLFDRVLLTAGERLGERGGVEDGAGGAADAASRKGGAGDGGGAQAVEERSRTAGIGDP